MSAVNVVLVVAAALIAIITADGRVQPDETAVSLVVTLVGGLGLAFAASYTELFHRNRHLR